MLMLLSTLNVSGKISFENKSKNIWKQQQQQQLAAPIPQRPPGRTSQKLSSTEAALPESPEFSLTSW